jgi:hypothetical protein
MVSGTSYNEGDLLPNSVIFYCTEIGKQLHAHVLEKRSEDVHR